jgi:hypothetical protein
MTAKKITECDVKNVLVTAIEVLENQGWCRNQLHNYSTGASCSMGAIVKGVQQHGAELPESQQELLKEKSYKALGAQIAAWCEKNDKTVPRRFHYMSGEVNIASWNDSYVSDKRTVLRVFKKAVAAVECD